MDQGFRRTKKFKAFGFKSLIFCYGAGFCLFSLPLHSAVIRFPEKELASEYVFPVFKDPQAVLGRNVSLRQRFEIKLSGILRTDEPFYSSFSASANLSFYFSEAHGVGVSGLFFPPHLNSRGETMRTKGIPKEQKAGVPTAEKADSFYDAGLAPIPFLGMFLNYYFSPLYGKISLTKTQVFNFALYAFLGLGSVALKHGSEPLYMIPASHFGLGQKIYFGSYFALDVGIDFLVYRGPNFVSKKLRWQHGESRPARPAYDSFEKDIFLRFLARAGIVILL